MDKTQEATARPWRVGGHKDSIVYNVDGWAICNAITYHNKGDPSDTANAALIVRAVNAHDVLADALRLVVNRRTADFTIDEWAQLKAALKLAGDA